MATLEQYHITQNSSLLLLIDNMVCINWLLLFCLDLLGSNAEYECL